MIRMVTLIKNTLLEKVKSAGALTDAELYKSMTKDGSVISEDRFNKLLLDLEILGLIKVSWATKDGRRIEITEDESEYDGDDLKNNAGGNGAKNNRETNSGYAKSGNGHALNSKEADTSYEASFPGLEK